MSTSRFGGRDRTDKSLAHALDVLRVGESLRKRGATVEVKEGILRVLRNYAESKPDNASKQHVRRLLPYYERRAWKK